MRTAYWLLFLVLLCIRNSSQRIDKKIIDSEKKSETSLKNDEFPTNTKKDWNLKRLQQLLKQATNSSLNAISQMTATSQGPCTCGGGVCACCSRILLDTLKQKACVDVTYDPDEFSFTAKISMNDNVFYTRTVSCMYASFINYIIYLLNFPFIQKFTYVCNCFQGKILAQYVYQCHDFNLSKHASDFITFISKVGIFIRVWTWRGSLETPRYLRWDIV